MEPLPSLAGSGLAADRPGGGGGCGGGEADSESTVGRAVGYGGWTQASCRKIDGGDDGGWRRRQRRRNPSQNVLVVVGRGGAGRRTTGGSSDTYHPIKTDGQLDPIGPELNDADSRKL